MSSFSLLEINQRYGQQLQQLYRPNQRKIMKSFSLDLGRETELSKEKILSASQQELQQQQQVIVGIQQHFITKKQLNSREIDRYQREIPGYQNWEPLARYERNIQYANQNVRTPSTLIRCFNFIKREYFPYLKNNFQNYKQRKRVCLFLYERVKAIRCQLHVQNHFDPKTHFEILKLMLFLESITEQQINPESVQYYIEQYHQNAVSQEQKNEDMIKQVIQYSILARSRESLHSFLAQNCSFIENDSHLQKLVESQLKILNGNYFIYLKLLSSKNLNIFSRIILWGNIENIRTIIIDRYKKARMKTKGQFLCKVLGFIKRDEQIDMGRTQQYKKFIQTSKHIESQIELWINKSCLQLCLDKI